MNPHHQAHEKLPQDRGGQVFGEPWEAHAFALAVRLAEAGYFTWHEWTTFLSQEIRGAEERDERNVTYYQQWLAALEKLCVQKGLATSGDMARRKAEWREAYLHTPHGHPVELSAGLSRH